MTLRARETFFVGNAKVSRGQLINENDPIARKAPHLLEPVRDDVPLIEQATAAPGEKRSVRRKAK